MHPVSRTLLTLPAAALLLAGLAACGNAPIPSEDQAGTIACRGYVVDVGSADTAAGKELKELAGAGTTDRDTVQQKLVPVRAAAAAAARTAGLSEEDFGRFLAVVRKADAVVAAVKPLDDGTTNLAIAPTAEFAAAVAAVHERCS